MNGNGFIKLTSRAKEGYHYSDSAANAELIVNINKIDYYYDLDERTSIISVAGKEFKCFTPAETISRLIDLENYVNENLER